MPPALVAHWRHFLSTSLAHPKALGRNLARHRELYGAAEGGRTLDIHLGNRESAARFAPLPAAFCLYVSLPVPFCLPSPWTGEDEAVLAEVRNLPRDGPRPHCQAANRNHADQPGFCGP